MFLFFPISFSKKQRQTKTTSKQTKSLGISKVNYFSVVISRVQAEAKQQEDDRSSHWSFLWGLPQAADGSSSGGAEGGMRALYPPCQEVALESTDGCPLFHADSANKSELQVTQALNNLKAQNTGRPSTRSLELNLQFCACKGVCTIYK